MFNRILVTGASGFIGSAVVNALLKVDKSVVVVFRKESAKDIWRNCGSNVVLVEIGDINGETCWQKALEGVDTIIHCAARSFVMQEQSPGEENRYREVNVAGTLRLAQQAGAAGVKRFVFLSSIKVCGEKTLPGEAFTEASPVAPQDAYGQSKAEAEEGLLSFSKQAAMELVIIRPPIVVGFGAKGNLANLLRWVKSGIPLPLGAVHNKRSLVSLDNLVSLVLLCADRERAPQAANQVFVVADAEDVSTTTLLRKVADAGGDSCWLCPVPTSLLRTVAVVFGKRDIADRLLGNLQIDSTKVRMLLGWRPTVTLDQQLARMF
jgi:nucleoside-diphosphate-sugar epimerase